LANASNVTIRETIAKAVGTTSDRVAVHTMYRHDSPGSDLDTEQLLAENGLGGRFSNAQLDQRLFLAIADAARDGMITHKAESVTQVGFGSGKIEKVAFDRRVLGPDGKVASSTRMSALIKSRIKSYGHVVFAERGNRHHQAVSTQN
jgi:hypothetical protein